MPTKQSPANRAPKSDPLTSCESLQAVELACMILKRFHEYGSVLSLDEVVNSVPHTRATALRLLHTLVEEGMLEHLPGNKLALTASTGSIVPQPYWLAPRAIA